MSDEARTKLTIETVLECINALSTELRAFRIAVEARLEQIETRLDRTQGVALGTRADLRELRADLRHQFKQPVA
jgi:predicted phage tail protein